jgi:hypothetical protein
MSAVVQLMCIAWGVSMRMAVSVMVVAVSAAKGLRPFQAGAGCHVAGAGRHMAGLHSAAAITDPHCQRHCRADSKN